MTTVSISKNTSSCITLVKVSLVNTIQIQLHKLFDPFVDFNACVGFRFNLNDSFFACEGNPTSCKVLTLAYVLLLFPLKEPADC